MSDVRDMYRRIADLEVQALQLMEDRDASQAENERLRAELRAASRELDSAGDTASTQDLANRFWAAARRAEIATGGATDEP